MIRTIAAALILTALAPVAALAQSVEDRKIGAGWSLIIITDDTSAATSTSVLMGTKAACEAAARVLVTTKRSDIHRERIAHCVSVTTGDVVTFRQD